MKEDLAIAKNNLSSLFEENKRLRAGEQVPEKCMKISVLSESTDSSTSFVDVTNGDVVELKQRLEEERKLRLEADKELQLQVISKKKIT